MFKQKSKILTSVKRVSLLAILVIVTAASFVVAFSRQETAGAATNSTINFQARLLTAAGNVVPDGDYNVEFKLYNALSSTGSSQGSCSGDSACLWTETRTTTNRVRTVNGYLTVNLGSVSSFPAINWDQELWLTMNIGGTPLSPSWDGEMNPRLKLTSVPYAFRAGTLVGGTGANTTTLTTGTPSGTNTIQLPAESGTICLQTSVACGFLTGSAADYIQNQNASSQTMANFWISGTGRADTALQAPLLDTAIATALNIGTTNATAINLNQNTTIATGKTLTVTGGATTLTGGGTGDAFTVSNATSSGNIAVFKDNTTTVATIANGGAVTFINSVNSEFALQVQNAAGGNVLSVNTSGTGAPVTIGRAGVSGHAGAVLTGIYQGTSSSNQTFSFSSNVPAGSTIVGSLALGSTAVTTATITDSKGNTYSVDASVASGSVTTGYVFSGRITNALTTSDTLTIDLVSGTGRWLVSANAYDNLLTPAVDQISTNTAANTAMTTGATPTTTAANELVYATFSYGSGRTFTPEAGFTTIVQQETTAGSNDRAMASEWKYVTSTGAQTATATLNTSGVYAAAAVTYKSMDPSLTGVGGAVRLSDGTTNNRSAILGTNNLTADRSILLSDESGTICIQNSANCGFAAASGSANYIQNGTALQTANFYVQSAAINSVGGIIRGAAGQTSSLLQLLDGTSGLTVAQFTNNGYLHLGSDSIARTGQIVLHDGTTSNSRTLTLIAPASLGASRTVTLPDETGIVCLQSSTGCGFAPASGSANYIQNQTAGQQASSDFWISGTGRTDTALQSPVIRATADGTTAIQFQNATGTNTALSIDTTNYRVAIGNAGTAFAAQQALDVIGNIQVRDAATATKAYRLRTSGGALDFEAGGTDIVYSAWSGADFTGTQRSYLRLESGAHIAQAIGDWQFRTAASGTTRHSINGTAGANVSFNANGEATNFTIQGDTDANLFFAQGSTDRIGIGTNTPGYKLDVNGDTNIAVTSSYRVGGVAICTSAGCTPAAGSPNYIQNGTTIQASSNFAIRSAAVGSVSGVIQGASGQTADIFQVQTWNGTSATTVLGVSAAGLVSANAGLTVSGALSQSTGTISLASNGTASYTSTGAATITAGAASTWSTSSGDLTVQSATTSTLNLRTGGAGTVAVGDVNTTTINVGRGSDIARSINIGTAGTTTAQAIAIGSTGSTSSTSIQGGTGDVTLTSTDLIIAKATTSLQIQNASNNPLLYADTANGRVGIGGQATFSMFEVLGGDAAVYNNGNNPRLILGDSTAGGQNGYLQWDSTNNYFRIESVGTNGLKINDNFVAIGNIFPSQPLIVGNGSTNLFQVNTTGSVLGKTSTDSTTGFQVQDALSNPVFDVDTDNIRVGIGNNAPNYTLDVTGDVNISTGSSYRINGTAICTSSGCTPAAGSANYIQNQNAGQQATSNFWISGTGRVDTSLQAPLLDTATAVALNIGTTNATAINLNKSVTVTGNLNQSTGTVSLASNGTASYTSTGATTITAGAASTWSTSAGGLTVQAATTNTLSLQTGGAGTVALGNVNTTTIDIGRGSNIARTIRIGDAGTSTIQAITIGSTGSTSSTTIRGGTGSTAISLVGGTNGSINLTASGTGNINLTSAANIVAKATTVFQVQNASNVALLSVDTAASSVSIGTTGTNTIAIGTALNTTNLNGGIVAGTSANASRFYVPWLSGDTLPTLYVGSSNASNGTIALRAESYGDTGVYGSSVTAVGVYGESTNSFGVVGEGALAGVLGTGTTGVGIQGESDSSYSAFFRSSTGANTQATLMVQRNGTSTANLIEVQNAAGNGAYFTVGGDGTVKVGALGAAIFDTSNNLYLGNGTVAAAPSNFVIQGTGSSTTGVAGGSLTLQGGNGTVGNANGGNITLTGGTGVGSGVRGLVVIDTPTFATATTQSCASNCTITQANVDGNGAVLIAATNTGVTATLPNPTLLTAGRIMYVTNVGANDFTLSVNGGGAGNLIAMRTNTSATMIWNGADWTAAGASSSTDLQSAYNNTLTSAGGAELVLNAPGGSADGLTIRNNPTTPISGGILEVQTSIGTNLFSVNNNISELVANGGAEDNSTFSTNWQSYGTSTVTRNTTTGQYATGAAGAQFASTTANSGIRSNLATNPALGTNYMVSFTAKLASGSPAFSDLIVQYSPNGGTTLVLCIQDQTIVSTDWTRITCEVDTGGTAVSNADLLIYQVADPGAPTRTVYIDNLSMTLADDAGGIPNNVQIGGGIYGGAPTLFTLDRSSAPPVENNNETYLGSMYYDTTSGRIQCYEADGWGACGSAPNNYVNLLPEYPGAVLNGTGVGTMTANFCSDTLNLNDGSSGQPTICSTNDTINYYQWTSPQPTEQVYSIFVTYQLPASFKNFDSNNSVELTARTSDTATGSVTYQMYRDTGSGLSQCGTGETPVTTSSNAWQTVGINGDEADPACGFSAASANGFVIFKINVKARSNANVYIGNLSFTTVGQ